MSSAQILQALDLKQDEFLLLFTVVTPTGFISRFCSKYPVTFMGVDYEFLPNKISGIHDSATEELSRPSWEIQNPHGMFNKIAISGELEGAIVDLIRVRESDLASGGYVETRLDKWRIYRIVSVNTMLQLELRKISDFPKGKFPVRGYYPPDFRSVTF